MRGILDDGIRIEKRHFLMRKIDFRNHENALFLVKIDFLYEKRQSL